MTRLIHLFWLLAVATASAHARQEPLVMCDEILRNGQGLACTFTNACVQLGDDFEHHKIVVPYWASKPKKGAVPRFVQVHARKWESMPSNRSRYGRIRVEFEPASSDIFQGRDWIKGANVVVEHTCWNYGHWLYDSLIPVHRLLRNKKLNRHEKTVSVWNLPERTEDTCTNYYEDGLLPGFAFLNMRVSKCFEKLVSGLSLDWGLEFQYHPGQYHGPDLKQYRAFRDSAISPQQRLEDAANHDPKRAHKKRKLLFCDRLDNRQIRNKDELLSFLRRKLGSKWKIEKVLFDDMTQTEQALRISDADVVLGFSGSNVLNAVYGKDDLRVIELLSNGMHNFHSNTFKKMPHLCHRVYRASFRETIFVPDGSRPISNETFAELAVQEEDWKNLDSLYVWRKSSAIELDLNRFWEALGSFIIGRTCNH